MEIVFLLSLAVTCSFLQSGLALHCYDCNSHYNESCRHDPPDFFKKKCSNEKPICRVMYMEVKTDFEGMTSHDRIVRSCGDMDDKDETRPCYRIAEYGVSQQICSCREESCNSSSMPVAATFLVLLTTSLMVY